MIRAAAEPLPGPDRHLPQRTGARRAMTDSDIYHTKRLTGIPHLLAVHFTSST